MGNKKTIIHFSKENCPQCENLAEALTAIAQEPEFLEYKIVSISLNNKNLKNIMSHEGVLLIPEYRWLYDEKDMLASKKFDVNAVRRKIKNNHVKNQGV